MSEGVAVKTAKKNLTGIVKGVFVALLTSVVGILIFAVVLKFVLLNDLTIKIVNQIIKILSVFFGVKVAIKDNKSNGVLKGMLVGSLYTIFSYLLFSILSNSFSFGLTLLIDIFFSCIFAVIFGIILVNSKDKT